jgi:ATP-dependent exoDNAse (exonuclease V) beta subunit
MAINKQTTVPELVAEAYPHLEEHLDPIEALRARYVEFKARRQLVDYDDLLVKLRDALAAGLGEGIGRLYRTSWSTSTRTRMCSRRRSSACSPRSTTT